MAGASSRIFISHLADAPVFDPNGDQVGRLRDVVVSLRPGGRPPRVLGFVVEVVSRRRIFMPITRVTTMEAGQVITTGTVNLRRFQQRPGETLVLGELLDRQVAFTGSGGYGEPGEEAVVLDVSMAKVRNREWDIDKVFVQRGKKPGRLRRGRGETLVVDWSGVSGFSLSEQDQGAANLLATFEKLRPADLANVLHHLSPKRRSEVAAALDDERLADVLEELPEDHQVEIIGELQDERAADVLEAMDPDDAADLLSELPPEESERLLQLMEPQEAEPVRRLLSYDENTAGGLMTSEPIVLSPDASVAEALARVREQDVKAALAAQVFVCRAPLETPTGMYLGTVHFQKLLREPPYTLVGSIVDDSLDPLGPETELPQVTSYLASYNLVAAPVVDELDHLLGVVTVDDVLDHLLPSDWRDSAGHHRGAEDAQNVQGAQEAYAEEGVIDGGS
ncbi:magnesium transporter MgtE N-terminal domain-containing protein [Phaeacidiphilus oryzae]|uniref:magnesium transporter MgtE N-terminal domain-containing protein n=1 Tax=Phaeacidiphilus oryzae TaxID=348818 RepID=UPI000563C6DF|nr:CBS domain-containing protein [Phaeacidiphilus oryzae]